MGWSLTWTWCLAENDELSQSDWKDWELGLHNLIGSRVSQAEGSRVTSGLIFVRGPNCLALLAVLLFLLQVLLQKALGVEGRRWEKGGKPALCQPTSPIP